MKKLRHCHCHPNVTLYEILTTTQSSSQPSCSSRSSSVVTLARPPTSSIVPFDMPHVVSGINSVSLRQPHPSLSLTHLFMHLSHRLLWFSSFVIHNVFTVTPGLKPICFTNPNSHRLFLFQESLYGLSRGPYLLSYRHQFVFSSFPYFLAPCGRLIFLSLSFLSQVRRSVSYSIPFRIVYEFKRGRFRDTVSV